MLQPPSWIEIRPDEDGNFDEVVAHFDGGMVHVETMTDKSVYIGFYKGERLESEGLQLWISAKKKLRYHHEAFAPRTLPEPPK